MKIVSSILFSLALTYPLSSVAKQSVSNVFAADNKTQIVLDIEAALARAQAQLDIIPQWAADELTNKANSELVTEEALAAEYKIVRHRMVALLNVWQRSIDKGAEQYMHFGATTVDIYDTTLVLQLVEASSKLLTDMRTLEQQLIELADKHKATVMIGRTLGQHALPITFGKKVSTWLGENRRNIERLKIVRSTLRRSAILKGAVGSYLGLGKDAIALEKAFSNELGIDVPYADDWHGSRDVFADYAATLAIISKSLARVGNELFLLQATDIAETEEVRVKTAVGSSTMPHKKNPSKSEALIFYGRSIPRKAEIVLDDMVNVFERDNTSRTNRVLADISIEAEKMLKAANGLIKSLKVNPHAMANNLNKTQGLIMAQRVTFALAAEIGKTQANDVMHKLAEQTLANKTTLRSTIEQSEYAQYFDSTTLDKLFDVQTYIGLAVEQTEAVIAYCKKQQTSDNI
jgi:adenylosuccinate lyase